MTTVVDYTLSEMILLAAHKLTEQGQSPFSAEDLIVASWRQFPRGFGLKGYAEQYPDSNRVLASIMGERGLARKGWLAKVGQKLYNLSAEGQRMVKRLQEGAKEVVKEEAEEPKMTRLPRDQEKLLLTLLESTAATKIGGKKAYELSFGDACRFWEITDHLSADALDARLAHVESTLAQAELLASRGSIHVGRREVTSSDALLLREVHDQLQERFSRHLQLLRSRAGK